ncbi:MAG TPA: glycosyltransferase family 9 protein [Vicinamibacteria bacterium]|nr:glycosyltransferase family 9 protein [Vicinamibacteria bacterium]
MPRRQRWTPVKGTRSRVHAPAERLALAGLDLPGRAAVALWRAARGAPAAAALDPATVREVLVLRLDRIGDVLMSLPALHDLRQALPTARIRLAVGRWSEEVARGAPVDEVLVWSAPWVGRADEGADRLPALLGQARRLRATPLDLALDLQGDVRASFLLALTGARRRAGYANTGGAWLLTDVLPLDETVPWTEQNRLAVALLLGRTPGTARPDPLTAADRDFARQLFTGLGLEARRPLVGIHPSGGRRVKQWDVDRWGEVAARLQREFAATVLITGGPGDRPLAEVVARGLPARAVDLSGKLSVRETLAVIAGLDLFLSPDTGPMHMAAAVGTPSVSVFGPSDPARYSSAPPGPRHVVVRRELWCSPCNLIRRPPAECVQGQAPECLRLVTVDDVYAAAARVLRERP